MFGKTRLVKTELNIDTVSDILHVFRYYDFRVLCPMEIRVLYSYSYWKSVGASGIGGTVASITPTLGGSIAVGQLTATTTMITVPNTGTYSFMVIKRIQGSISFTYNVSASQLVSTTGGSSYTWTDTSASFVVYSFDCIVRDHSVHLGYAGCKSIIHGVYFCTQCD